MDAGLGAAQFRHMAEAVADAGATQTDEPIAVVRCADGWRTLFADGSSHEGRPCSQDVMDELSAMVDRWRADNAELEGLAGEFTVTVEHVAHDEPAPRREVTELALKPNPALQPTPAPRPDATAFRPAQPPAAGSGSRFVPWSVVEAMIDVEVGGYFRRVS